MSAKRILKPSVQVDGKQTLTFEFDGKNYSGLQGDTLASALLANGVKAWLAATNTAVCAAS